MLPPPSGRKWDQLIEQTDRVAHRPLRCARDELHRLGVDLHLLRLRDVGQPRNDLLFTVPPKHELQIIDRKSTRLNSSHANISYAVFCLKKKKNISLTRKLQRYT